MRRLRTSLPTAIAHNNLQICRHAGSRVGCPRSGRLRSNWTATFGCISSRRIQQRPGHEPLLFVRCGQRAARILACRSSLCLQLAGVGDVTSTWIATARSSVKEWKQVCFRLLKNLLIGGSSSSRLPDRRTRRCGEPGPSRFHRNPYAHQATASPSASGFAERNLRRRRRPKLVHKCHYVLAIP